MFERVLIANRGEIAVRIGRTLRSLGIHSIAVYSDADRGARHVAEADTAVRLGPAAAAESYLHIERVIEAAVRAGAQALHPGYGFLSENVVFAAACEQAGIVFIGPPVAAIEAMGDKIRAKATVAANGVRVVPGVSGVGLSDDELIEAALGVGFPALIKPSAGGGGKGMRLVTAADQLAAEITSAKREARSSFGDDTLLIERYIQRPRHIEVQVLADAHDGIVHLGERECSLQRRHQKVIEEAPSPYLTDAQREALGEQAVAAARACGYVNAGTVEFIVSGEPRPDGELDAFFLEMNTRLQVEHPVTEMVWGIDLVEQQLRVAAGEPLGFTQSDLAPRGHSFEARVYAEDVDAGFLPTGGTVEFVSEPAGRPHVRVDSSLRSGTVVGSNYDPMLAKIIAWGDDRGTARRRLAAALSETTVLGLTTNITFLRSLLTNSDVAAGVLDTGLIERIVAAQPALARPVDPAIAAALVLLDGSRSTGAWGDRNGWRLGMPAATTMRLVDGAGHRTDVVLTSTADGWRATVDDHHCNATFTRDGDQVRLGLDGVTADYSVAVSDSGAVWIGSGGAAWRFDRAADGRAGSGAEAAGGLTLASPMPGTVVAVLVHEGDAVAAGQAIVIVEAMKMEHTLRAPQDAVVASVAVAAADRVELRQTLVVLAAATGAHEPNSSRGSAT